MLLGLSGGVDSSVAAALIHRAIGDQLTCVFVDHGLLRLSEAQLVMDMFAGQLQGAGGARGRQRRSSWVTWPASPTRSRSGRSSGASSSRCSSPEAKKLTNVRWLAQGTIYPDVIESGSAGKKAITIKSHHNVGGLPKTLGLKLLEPLRELFKDEVRELGVALGLPPRHGVPAPVPRARDSACGSWAR